MRAVLKTTLLLLLGIIAGGVTVASRAVAVIQNEMEINDVLVELHAQEIEKLRASCKEIAP